MSEVNLVQIIEGALLAAGRALSVAQIGELFEDHERPDNTAIREALAEVATRCEERGFELQEVASGFRFQVRQNLSPWVARLWHERPQRYSRALLETLALIAYRQPITRGEIEEIRGVAVSSNIIKTLHEREWIRVVGHRDVPGRPAMYATTRQFLDYFNLKNLDQLPALAEIRDLETLNAELGFSDPVGSEAANAPAEAEASPQQALAVVGGTDVEGVGVAVEGAVAGTGSDDPDSDNADTGPGAAAVDRHGDEPAAPAVDDMAQAGETVIPAGAPDADTDTDTDTDGDEPPAANPDPAGAGDGDDHPERA
ncbi:SMC-Scp complex subunit ScpB [Parahaliea mediterranea]|uniref:SMC-Scp complex subunit ScpB n=1 Tax=Parahaliea mediterranea TaxID=651086 RepID=A0A939IP92_9GAMM|nr:SMC-Scp complex subunit ScpB [Parahaliea mediterranea]MBN7798918.1 SMC-Scp complex subunit ScpB [Parahaliea mediterranea]